MEKLFSEFLVVFADFSSHIIMKHILCEKRTNNKNVKLENSN